MMRLCLISLQKIGGMFCLFHYLFQVIIKFTIHTSSFTPLRKHFQFVPILERGGLAQIPNVICMFPMVFEGYIYAFVRSRVKVFISSNQHGFVKRRLTISNQQRPSRRSVHRLLMCFGLHRLLTSLA